MPSRPITRKDDIDSGHGPYRPGMPAKGKVPNAISPVQHLPTPFNPFCCSGNVIVGTKGVHRQGDIRFAHINVSTGIPEIIDNPKAYGGGVFPWLKSGSLTAFANGKQIGRVGDSVVCSSTIVTGDPTVLVGD